MTSLIDEGQEYSYHLSVQCRHALNLYIRAHRQTGDADTRPSGERGRKELRVAFIHGTKVVHCGQVDIDLDDSLERRIGSVQKGRNVANGLLLYIGGVNDGLH